MNAFEAFCFLEFFGGGMGGNEGVESVAVR